MPASSRAHLLLPSPQGLVHYDLLEETAFLGPAPKGGLLASPTPFREAKAVLADDGAGYVVRALPGEAPPDVNGVPAEGARVQDGDRIRLGDQVALFRAGVLVAPAVTAAPAPAGTVAVPAAAPAPSATPGAATAPRARRAPARVTAPSGARQGARILRMVGALLLLFAAYQAVRFLQTPGPTAVAPVTPSMTKADEVVLPRAEQSAEDEFARIEAFERDHPADTDLPDLVARYAGLARSSASTAAGQRAAARVLEAWPRLAAFAWRGVSLEVDAAVQSGRYGRAITALQGFDARYGGTDSGALARARLESVRTGARAALDGLRQKVAPWMTTDPTRAYRVLTTSGLELPPDLDAELGALMARVRDLWGTPKEGPDGAGGPKEPGTRPGGGFKPPIAPPDGEPGPAPTQSGDRDVTARGIWEKARGDLIGRRWAEAKKGYASLLKEWKDAPIVASNLERVRAGRQAADFGIRGPAALLLEEATFKDGKLEVEYQFEEDKTFPADFTVDQPFPGEETASAEVKAGMAILSGATAMLLKVVFDPSDVTWEADCMADEPRDYGLIAFQEGHEYRAAAMHVGNTQFRLKKGSAAQVLAGHVLWMFGDGVWKDADPGERGFVRLAVRNGNSLKGGERARVRVEIRAGQMSGEIHSKADNVDLSGALKGDDGKGMGPLRVGCFAYKGRVGIQRLWVSGKVDAAWMAKEHERLIGLETGPDGK